MRTDIPQRYHMQAGERHAARFEVETSEIEFWFHRV